MKRRAVLTSTAAAAGLFALAGCGGSDASDVVAAESAPPGSTPPTPAPPIPPPPAPAPPAPSPPPPPPPGLVFELPAIGQAVAIGVNTANDVRPAGYSSDQWGYSLFNSYGTGAFVPDYSGVGAFVIAASGGHAAPANVDAVIFDFQDARWKRLANSNGVPAQVSDFYTSQTTGAPYFELKSASSGQMPAPVHLYQCAAYIPSSLGGGPKGSFLKMGSSAVTVESRQGTGIHRMDLSTGLWTRATNDTVSFSYSPVATTVFDPLTKRFYFVHDAFHVESSLQYLDAADWRLKRTASFPFPEGWQGPNYQTVFLDPVRRLLVAQRIGFPLRAIDLNNIPAGWITLRVAGTQPGEFENHWAYYEPDGRFYTRGNRSGQTLWRLTPPATDWKTGTWTYSTVTINGAAMPNHTASGGEKEHYGTLFYVPYLRSLAWVAGESAPVILLRPPA